MEAFDQITRWISENESLFSGLAAIVALVAIVPAALRPMMRRRHASGIDGERGRAAGPRPPSARPRFAVFPIQAGGASDEVRTAAEIMTVERIVGHLPAQTLAPWLDPEAATD